MATKPLRAAPKGDEQPDLFAAYFTDIATRDQRDTMERPFFSLSKGKRLKPIDYEVGNVSVKVTANAEHGMATIYDADILIWAVSQIRESLDRGEEASRYIRFHPTDLLKSVRRRTSGKEFILLREALRRLAGTYVETNIRVTEKRARTTGFHWLEKWDEERDPTTGKTIYMEMTIPDWLYQGILDSKGVLTIHEDYFLLAGGLERFLYRVARKHGGHQELGWQFTMAQLHEKSGVTSPLKNFVLKIREIVAADSLPEYALELHKNNEGAEIVSFIRRSKLHVTDERYEVPRHIRRRMAEGLHQRALKVSPTS